jgi:thioredoxin 1
MASSKIIELTDDTFSSTIKSGVTIVDFWAPWCGPCRTLAPMFDQLAEQMGDIVKVCKVNVDTCPSATTIAAIQSIPTFAIYKDGERVEIFVGGGVKLQTLIAALTAYSSVVEE